MYVAWRARSAGEGTAQCRRGDAESGNRQLEDTLYINRAHSVGHLRQQLDLIGFGIMINAIAYGRHRAREGIARVA